MLKKTLSKNICKKYIVFLHCLVDMKIKRMKNRRKKNAIFRCLVPLKAKQIKKKPVFMGSTQKVFLPKLGGKGGKQV